MNNQNGIIGRQFGNYRIEARLECGAFGCTFRARHIHLKRQAVIKLLRANRLDFSENRKRFFEEALFLESLHYRYILDIYDFGVDEQGILYLITEYAPGGSLRRLLNSYQHRPVPERIALPILIQVGKGLSFIHQQHILHHDLKPENILLSMSGEAMLGDFGIATYQQPPGTWQAHASIGSASYMAPEQSLGYISRRSEQYSFGCIAYELFTGRKPFSAPDTLALRYKHMHIPPPSPAMFNPAIPLHIELAILKMLEKRRINRFDSVLSAVEALYDAELTFMDTRANVILS